jgi:hypothetical protein
MDGHLNSLLKVLNLASGSKYECLPYCVELSEHLAEETDIALKQEIFDYVEQQIDNYQPPAELTMLMWYELAQAFSTVTEDPIIGIRSTRLYDRTYTKWQADYEVVLVRFSDESHADDYALYISELKVCGDERSLPLMETMVESNKNYYDDYEDNGAGGLPRYGDRYRYYHGAESAREVILQRCSIDRAAEEQWTMLDLSSKKLTKISSEIGKLKHLTSLDLSNNRIRQIPAEICELINLTSLNLSNTEIYDIESIEAIFKIKSLTSLSLSNNKIGKIPAAIGQLENLENLDLHDNFHWNDVAFLPIEIGNLQNLKYLNLQGSGLFRIPAEIGNLKSLAILNLQQNKISEIPDAIGKLKNLTHLNLSDNQIAKIPAAIGELENLTYLCLSDNNITEIPIEIGELKNLTYLVLADNKITVIPQWLQSSKNLKTLTVTGGDNGVDLNMDRSGCSFVIILPPEEENMWLK